MLISSRAQYLDLMIKMAHTEHCSASQNGIRECAQATDQNIPKHSVKQGFKQNHHQLNHRIKERMKAHLIKNRMKKRIYKGGWRHW